MKKENDSYAAIRQVLVFATVFMFIAVGGIVTYSNKLSSNSIKVNSIVLATNESEETVNKEIINSEEVYSTFRFQPLMGSTVSYVTSFTVEPSGEEKTAEVTEFREATSNKVISRMVFTDNFVKYLESVVAVNKNMTDLIKEEANSGDASVVSGELATNLESSGEQEVASDEQLIEVVPEEGSENIVIEGVPTNYVNYYDVTATAYCLCQKCCGKSPSSPGYGRTASGLRIIPNTGMKVIAVDPRLIPLGTNVYVEGLNGAPDYGYAVAADTGGAIKNMKIDLYFDLHSDCLKWGRRSVRVYVLPD